MTQTWVHTATRQPVRSLVSRALAAIFSACWRIFVAVLVIFVPLMLLVQMPESQLISGSAGIPPWMQETESRPLFPNSNIHRLSRPDEPRPDSAPGKILDKPGRSLWGRWQHRRRQERLWSRAGPGHSLGGQPLLQQRLPFVSPTEWRAQAMAVRALGVAMVVSHSVASLRHVLRDSPAAAYARGARGVVVTPDSPFLALVSGARLRLDLCLPSESPFTLRHGRNVVLHVPQLSSRQQAQLLQTNANAAHVWGMVGRFGDEWLPFPAQRNSADELMRQLACLQ